MARRILPSALLIPSLLGAQNPALRTDARERTALAITVYADGRALVQDTRRVNFPAGDFSLAFADVSSELRPGTALFRDRSVGSATRLLERNFEFDLISPTRLVERSLGRPVRVSLGPDEPVKAGIIRGLPHPATWAPPRTEGEARLRSLSPPQRISRRNGRGRLLIAENSDAVIETKDGFLAASPEEVQLLELPLGLRAQPTLVHRLETRKPGLREVDLTYLTSGISWQATYRADLHADAKHLDLSAFVTLKNTTATGFPEARLQLVAGEPNQAVEPPEEVDPDRARADVGSAVVEVCASSTFAEEKLAEYLLLSLNRPTTLLAGQEKQIFLFAAERVPVTVRRISEIYLGGLRYHTGWLTSPAWISCRIENARGGPLGRPLPRGAIYLSQDGRLLSETSDAIEDTPVGERVDIHLREDPRLKIEARLADSRQTNAWELFRCSPGQTLRALFRSLFSSRSDTEEETFGPRERWDIEVKIHNGLPTTQQPEIRLYLEPGWKILSSSDPTHPMDAARTLLAPRLKPDEARTIHLTVLKP